MRSVRSFAYASQASRAALAIALSFAGTRGQAQVYNGFQGTPTVAFSTGGAVGTVAQGGQVDIGTATRATINWVPDDHAIGGGAINFLPGGYSQRFVGSGSGPQTIVNRILPTDATRAIALNGAINSANSTNPDIRVWVYNAGGILIGQNANINLGGLVLTTADPSPANTNGSGDFMPVDGQFTLTGASGSTSAITIASGAQINAINPNQSNYVLAFAPQIVQHGTITANGTTAMVAGESASFAIDPSGLFNINVLTGSGVTSNTLVQDGTITGDAAANGYKRRIYLVAMPKNNAISMTIAAGGSLGFDVAGAAAVDDNAIVLSAGQQINDTGTGNPVMTGAAGQGSLIINGGTFTSQVYAGATQQAAVTLSGDATFNAGLQLQAPLANVDTGTHTLNVAGNMLVAANAGLANPAGSATVFSSGNLTVGGALTVSADNSYTGIGGGALQGPGGASVTAAGGAITVTGFTKISADGNFQNAFAPGVQGAAGGIATMTASGGGTITLGGMNISAQATGQAGGTVATMGATGGTVIVQATGANSHIASAGDLSLYASGSGGSDLNSGTGGNGVGGTATVIAASGGTVTLQSGSGLGLDARGYGSANGGQTPADAGSGIGGTATLSAIDGTIESPNTPKFSLNVSAYGGSANGAGGNAGSATGGTAQVTIGGTTGLLNLNGNAQNGGGFVTVSADATAGSSSGGAGGAAIGGRALITATGTGQVINAPQINNVSLSAVATGGNGSGANGGNGAGGFTQLAIGGGTAYLQTSYALVLNAQARGGDSDGIGGTATAGTVAITVAAGGTLTQTDQVLLSANTVRGSGNAMDGGTIGGTVLIQNAGTLNLDTAGSGLHIDTGGATRLGYTEISTSGGGTTIIGPNQSAAAGDLLINDYVINADLDPIKISAAGNLTLTANGRLISGFGDHIDLIADNMGTGSGVVTLPANAISQTTDGSVSVYSNPVALGSPTDYSLALTNGYGTIVSYQLINTVNQLQQVGNFLNQNFALSRDVDASVTQTWNGGAGFVPIGTSGTPFVGNFSGLGHQISGLTIHGVDYVGLFGMVDAGASITNLGLVNATISGRNYVGGLVGQVLVNSSGVATLSNDFVTGSKLSSSAAYIGGLVGYTAAPGGGSIVVRDSHADSAISVTGGATYATAGGLIGFAGAGQIDRSFATGSITSTSQGSIGGLVGVNSGTISDSYATTTINAPSGAFELGGLAGANYGTLNRVYATGAITAGTGGMEIGGLVGFNEFSSIAEGLASGAITAPGATMVGGLVGRNVGAQVQNSYWDNGTTGQGVAIGSDSGSSTLSNLNSVGGSNPNPYLSTSYGNLSGGNWIFLPGGSRPLGAWEVPTFEYGFATIGSAHQVQLIDSNLGGSYRLGQTIDMSGTGGLSDIWSPAGFQTIGQLVTGVSFTGTLNGQGHSLLNLRIAANGSDAALIEENRGTISDIGLYNAQVSTVSGNLAGALTAVNYGTIRGSYATGSVSGGTATTGGLVGYNGGGITNSYASVAVTGGASSLTGGLVGQNIGAIDFTYANGPVSGGSQVGGLVGSASGGSITRSYWNRDLYAGNGCGTGANCSGLMGLTTAQIKTGASFTGWSIANSGGQGMIWRIYDGSTAPLLTRFLQTANSLVSDATLTYTGAPLGVPVSVIGADPSHIYGTPAYSGNGRNAGIYSVSYAGGLYSDQLGYDIVASPGTANLTITPATLALTATSDSRSYNAGRASSGQVAVAGLQGSDSISSLAQTFDSANVGSRTLSVANGYAINDGNNGGNYTVTTYSVSGSISQAALTLAAVASGKSYDATTTSSATVQVTGLRGNDSVTGLTQHFDSANAGNRALTVAAGYTVNDGNGGGNYSVSLTGAAGVITPAALTLAAVTDGKTYDATAASVGQVQVSGLKGNDTVTGLTQAFDSANAGNRALAVATNYVINDGNGGGNYTVTRTGASGSISQAALTLAAVTNSKTYDATTASSAQVQVTGLKGSDTVTGLIETFDSANAGNRTLAVAAGYAVNDGNGGANYTVSLTGATGVITPATLTLAAVADSRTYNATTASAGQVQVAGLKGSDTVSGLTQVFDNANAGARTLAVANGYTINDGNGGANYTLSLTGASGSIGQAALTLAAVASSKSYDATTTSSATVQVTGLRGNDSVTGLTQHFDSANAGNRALTVAAGYTVNDGNGGGNYAVSLTGAAGVITPAALTLAAVTDGKTYDATAASAGQVQVSGLKGNDTVTSLTQAFDSANVGNRALSVANNYVINDGNGGGNYAVSLTNASGVITTAALRLTAVADSRTYNATTGSGGQVQISGLKGNDTISGLTQAFDSANVGARTLTVANGYTVNDGNGGANYAVSISGASGSIARAALTLAAVTNSKIYDATTGSSAQVQVTGLKGGDTVTGLREAFDSANAGSRTLAVAGGYVINDGNGGGNYAVTLGSASGSISKAALTLAAAADSKTYDATTASSGQVQVTGLKGSDTVTGLNQAFDSANAGNRALTVANGYVVSDGNGGGNYTVALTSAAGVITPATLTLAAVTDSRTYNAMTASAGQVQVSGLKGSDTVTGLMQAFDSPNIGARALAVANGYTINDGNGGANYSVTRAGASGSISQAALMLAAVSDSRTYDATTVSSGKVGVLGLQGSDTVSGLAQAFDSANVGSRTLAVAGGYTISDGNGGGNYNVTRTTASGTIGQAALSLAATADSKTYDATMASSAKVQVSGLKGGNTVTGLTEAYDSANAGNRTLAVAGGYVVNDGNNGGNYAVSLAQASGVITPAALVLAAASDSRTYDATTVSAGQVQVTGLKGTDTVIGLTQAFDSADAGARTLTVSSGYTISDGNKGGNYTISLAAASGRITPASLTVTYTSTKALSVYGNAIGALSGSASATGFLGGDTAASALSGAAAFTANAGGVSPVGTYAVLGSGLTSTGNYQVDAVQAAGNAGALTITARPITVTADAQDRAQGFPNPLLTYTVAGPTAQSAALVNGDQLSGGLATSATTNSPAGSYAITQGTLAAGGNYALSFVSNVLTVRPGVTVADLQQAPQAVQTIAAVAPNVTAQADATPQVTPTAQEQQEEQKAVASSTKPAVVRAILINDGTVAISQPVDEDVTSNGSSGLWSPK